MCMPLTTAGKRSESPIGAFVVSARSVRRLAPAARAGAGITGTAESTRPDALREGLLPLAARSGCMGRLSVCRLIRDGNDTAGTNCRVDELQWL